MIISLYYTLSPNDKKFCFDLFDLILKEKMIRNDFQILEKVKSILNVGQRIGLLIETNILREIRNHHPYLITFNSKLIERACEEFQKEIKEEKDDASSKNIKKIY